eukprot:33786_1
MDDFFEKLEPIQLSRCCDPDDDAKQLISDHDDEIEKWWFQQTEQLKHNIEVQFTNSEEEYELVGINLLYNSKHATKYLQFKGYENSVLMFHGARQEDMGSIFKTGFRFSSKSIGSLYGKGHYFTPQALHAIRYLYTCKGYSNQEQFALIAAFVNPGKIKTVKGKEYIGINPSQKVMILITLKSRTVPVPMTVLDIQCIQITKVMSWRNMRSKSQCESCLDFISH